MLNLSKSIVADEYVSPSLKFIVLGPKANMMSVASPNSWNQGGAGNGGFIDEEDEEY